MAGRLARPLRTAEKVYLADVTEIENPGARIENVVALHLLRSRFTTLLPDRID